MKRYQLFFNVSVLQGCFLVFFMCLLILSTAQTNYSKRSLNIYVYQGNYDYTSRFIPLYGRVGSKLTIKVYNATQYMGEWIKETEYPKSEYYCTYNNDGLLSTVETSKIIKRYEYKYDSENEYVLNRVDAYNKSTGEKDERSSINYSHRTKYFVNYNYRIFYETFSSYFCKVSSTENIRKDNGWAVGWETIFQVCGYNSNDNTYLCIYDESLSFSRADMIKTYGLSWQSGLKAPTILSYYPSRKHYLFGTGLKCNRAGLPMKSGMGNIDAWGLEKFVDVSNKTWYEYEWYY